LGFCHENGCEFARPVFIWGIFVLQPSPACGELGVNHAVYFLCWTQFLWKLCLMIFAVTFTDCYGLALGSEFMGISTIQCKLSQDLWSWSKSPYPQRNMEGSQVLYLCLWENIIQYYVHNVQRCFSWFSILTINILTVELSVSGSAKYIGNQSNCWSGGDSDKRKIENNKNF